MGSLHLFLSEMYRPLSRNAVTQLFWRLKKWAGITEKRVSPLGLRATFAVEYLQKGGTREALGEILGMVNVAELKRYERLNKQGVEHEKRKEPAEEHSPTQKPAPRKSKQRRKRSSSAPFRKRLQQGMSESDGSADKRSAISAEDDL